MSHRSLVSFGSPRTLQGCSLAAGRFHKSQVTPSSLICTLLQDDEALPPDPKPHGGKANTATNGLCHVSNTARHQVTRQARMGRLLRRTTCYKGCQGTRHATESLSSTYTSTLFAHATLTLAQVEASRAEVRRHVKLDRFTPASAAPSLTRSSREDAQPTGPTVRCSGG